MDQFSTNNSRAHGMQHRTSSDARAAATNDRSTSNMAPKGAERSSSYQSFPSPSTVSSTHSVHRTDSDASASHVGEQSQRIDAEWARYTDAPPPYSKKQYEGKSENEQNDMRRQDYAKEISRQMGQQLVKGMKADQTSPQAK